MKRLLRALGVAAVLLLGWQAVILVTGLPRYILPAPGSVLSVLWSDRALIGEHALITLLEVVIGLVLGVLLGGATAITLAASHRARAWMRPMLLISQALPVFALAPLLTLWLGYGLASKIAMALLIIYFPVTSSFFDGLMRTPAAYLDLAQSMGASKWRTLLHIRIPAALPSLASGLRLAAVYAPIGAVIGEWVGSSQGLGYLMLLANGRVKTDLMFAAMFVLAALSISLYFAVDAGLKRAQRHSL